MSSGQGSTKNLAQGSQEAFQALINSLAPEAALAKDGKLTPGVIEKLSEKLKELVGEDTVKSSELRRNERGELVNEEGLPIIEISEPVSSSESKDPGNHPIISDVPLINLSSLPSVAREKLRLQRDRILDTLEEEEHRENERQERAEREEREEILRKRKEEAVNEKARLQKAKELQKKMGKTLMRNMGYSGTGDNSPPKEGRPEVHTDSQPDSGTKVRKKTVAFVETSDPTSSTSKSEWGDVTAARLRPGQRPTLLQAFRLDSNPVKLSVIERKPAGHASAIPSRPTPFPRTTKDSDDESEPEDNLLRPASDSDESDEILEELPDSGADDGEVELENEYDLDYAQHQREIALEYYKKRSIIGQDTAKAMMSHTHEDDELEPTPEVPTPNNQPKPSISRFKANRIASSYGASTRIEQSIPSTKSVVPESTARTIQHTIRSGRIDDDNRLVGGEHASDSENEAEGLQEALELLRKGEVYNLGPDGHYLHNLTQPNTTMVMTPADVPTSSPTVPPSSIAAQQHEQRQLPSLKKSKVSKFKADRSQAGRPSTSTPPTPVSHIRRSSPHLSSSLAGTILEKTQPNPPSALEARSVHTSPSPNSPSPIIIESPSFAHPQMNTSAQPLTSTVIDSPSFPNRSRGPTEVPAGAPPQMIIVDSPSFPPPGQHSRRPEHPPAVIPSQSLATGIATPAGRPVAASAPLPTRTIVASVVQERTAPTPKSDQRDSDQGNRSDSTPKKVSRFKQTRERD